MSISAVSKTLQASPSPIHMGLDGFVWWVGVVEDRMDPLHLGRARVRIYAWHSENKNMIPTENLPWAHVMHPINGTHGPVVPPKEGTCVMGFFMDGKEAEHPVIMGIFNGIPETVPPANQGFSDPGTNVSERPAPPGQSPTRYPAQVNEPTTPRLTRNEDVEDGSGATYLEVRDVSRVTTMTATALIPEVASLARTITLPIPVLGSALSSLSGGLSSALSGVTGSLTGSLAGLTGSISGSLTGAVSGVSGQLTGQISNITSGATSRLGAAISQRISGLATSAINQATAQINNKIISEVQNVDQTISEAISPVTTAVNEIQTEIDNVTFEAQKALSEIAETAGIALTAIEAINEAGAVIEDLKNLGKKALEIENITGGFSVPSNLPENVQAAVQELGLSDLANFTSTSEPVWQEPASPYNAKYPYNIVTQTESGHVLEVDDTPGAERIHTRHRTGTYQEMQPDGTMVTHVFGNNYHIVAKDNKVKIAGVCDITIEGDANLLVKKDLRTVVMGDAVWEFKKNLRFTVGQNMIIENGGDLTVGTTGMQTYAASMYNYL